MKIEEQNLVNKVIGLILFLIGIILSGYARSIQCDCSYCIPFWFSGLTIFIAGAIMFYKK
jgi:hypothetical protein